MEKVILEARINEYAMRDGNPDVPWSKDEIVEAAVRVRQAGASILHFHARAADGGPDNRPEVYADLIQAIRKETDILLLPTLGFNSNDKDGRDRIRIISALAEDPETKPDIIPLDTGSVNLELYDQENHTFLNADAIYANPTDVLAYCAEEMRARGIKVKMTCWDMGFVRRGRILIEQGLITRPGYFLFHLTEGKYITGHPCTEAGVDALRSVLPNENCYWSVNCLGGDLLKLAPYVLKAGGGLAIGLGDYHYAAYGLPKNEDLICKAVELAHSCGREPATPDEVRQMLQL